MLTHFCAPNCCHRCLPALLTPTALCNFPPLAALGCLPCWKMGGTDILSLQSTETISALALLLSKLQPSELAPQKEWQQQEHKGVTPCHAQFNINCCCQPCAASAGPSRLYMEHRRKLCQQQGELRLCLGLGEEEMEQPPPHVLLQQRPKNTYCNLQLSAPNIINVQSQPDEHLKGEHGLLSSLTPSKKDFIFGITANGRQLLGGHQGLSRCGSRWQDNNAFLDDWLMPFAKCQW